MPYSLLVAPEPPDRVTADELADLTGTTSERVAELADAGLITPDAGEAHLSGFPEPIELALVTRPD